MALEAAKTKTRPCVLVLVSAGHEATVEEVDLADAWRAIRAVCQVGEIHAGGWS